MNKAVAFLRTNNFIKGLILLILAIGINYLTEAANITESSPYVFWPLIAVILIFLVASIAFFFRSAIKEETGFKVASTMFLSLIFIIVIFWLVTAFNVPLQDTLQKNQTFVEAEKQWIATKADLETRLSRCLSANQTFVDQEKDFKNVTTQYSSCINNSSDVILSLNQRASQSLSNEQWQQLQRDYIKANADLLICLKQFEGKQIFVK